LSLFTYSAFKTWPRLWQNDRVRLDGFLDVVISI
jgi:hypothetical protein